MTEEIRFDYPESKKDEVFLTSGPYNKEIKLSTKIIVNGKEQYLCGVCSYLQDRPIEPANEPATPEGK